ncbi:hypothetical protein [Paenibacillus xerothermodurans]|uniref:hypothetical protein n=1 Tax=Paenibacillus xerothermodurans TaxID=1977292 RepID=UPI001403D14E|nr:hypothetical protein [Paenibacillus xerothermodurans]
MTNESTKHNNDDLTLAEISKKAIIAGTELDFWFEGDDDIYDELYGHLSAGRRLDS